MNVKRIVGIAVATFAFAFGLAHLMQSGFTDRADWVAQMPAPVTITPLAEGRGSTAELLVEPPEQAGNALPDTAFDAAPITALPPNHGEEIPPAPSRSM